VPGNEPRLAQFLVQGEIQAAALRGTTVAQLNEVKLRRLGNYVDEWKKLTKSSSVPVIGVGAIRSDYLAKNGDAVVKFVVGMKEATDWGARNTPRVSEILQKAANMKADDADAYAKQWSSIYKVSLEAEDVAMLKRMGEIFRQAGTIKNPIPDTAFATEPYTKAKAQFAK
jgi:NitT/TauT family transport system substrate-binding protein